MGVAEKLLQLAHIAILLPALLAINHKPGCPNECGDLTDIPYPFGIGEHCYLDPLFSIECNRTYDPPRAFWQRRSTNITITDISFVNSDFQIMLFVSYDCYNKRGDLLKRFNFFLSVPRPFTISNTMNKFTVIGCDSYAFISGTYYSSGCLSICSSNETVEDGSCSGVGCCQVEIPKALEHVTLEVRSFYNHKNVSDFNPCGYALLVEDEKFKFRTSYLSNFPEDMVLAVLNWAIKNDTCQSAANNRSCICGGNTTLVPIAGEGSDYHCKCLDGYEGNPYLPLGCQDIDECKSNSTNKCKYECINTLGNYTCPCQKRYRGDARIGGEGCTPKPSFLIQIIVGIGVGVTVLVVGTSWLYLDYKKWKLIKLKEKFFEGNGGFMLQQELSMWRGREADTAKIFSQEELEKATNKFEDAAVVGKGGYGTVYKGVLEDGSVVAIKKSKIVNQSQTQQFVNEVLVLSQIRHRNVVKLLGCCLETEVPLLVYEFVNNRTDATQGPITRSKARAVFLTNFVFYFAGKTYNINFDEEKNEKFFNTLEWHGPAQEQAHEPAQEQGHGLAQQEEKEYAPTKMDQEEWKREDATQEKEKGATHQGRKKLSATTTCSVVSSPKGGTQTIQSSLS